jgi:recombinational DNA repair protein (RecF pathway)
VPGVPLQTDAFVVSLRPPTDSFQTITVFSAEHGLLLVLHRLSTRTPSNRFSFDLFDEVSLNLESRNQGETWFVKEARLITRHAAIGRSYDTLRFASAVAALVARNPVPEESRSAVVELLRQAFASFSETPRPDLVWFKCLYRFARDEGYPMKEEWFPTLPASDRSTVAFLLNRPLAAQTAEPEQVARLTQRLVDYLQHHTEILID